ncbi:MAG: endonuclease MutS2, partial [Acidobacteriota bacterium]
MKHPPSPSKMILDHSTTQALEFDGVRRLLSDHARTPMGRERAAVLEPQSDPDRVEAALALTADCRGYASEGHRISLAAVGDPSGALSLLAVEGTSLDPQQILGLECLAAAAREFGERFREAEARAQYPSLAGLAARVPDMNPVLSGLRGKLLPDGSIDDNASPELRHVRRDLLHARARVHRHLESIMKTQARAVQEDYITFRNERFVIPVRTDARGLVPGVVHGLSSSGQTTYLEPIAVIEQNNEIVRLREREQLEIARILLALTELLRSNVGALGIAAEVVTELDLADAKARLADQFDCARPALSDGRRLLLKEARHLLLEHNLRAAGGRAVPISLEMDAGRRVLVVSGPNAGGKTVVLKTIGLACLMAQAGMHVPAREAELPLVREVFADIGDQQSITANLSTFTAHMRNVARTASRVTAASLVLIDEVGTGTDPDEGSALAVSILDYFRLSGALVAATTHYNEVKAWAAGAEAVVNAAVEFDEQTLQPTYRLLWGVAGASSGLEIARRMEVPPVIVEDSSRRLDPAHLEANRHLREIRRRIDELEDLGRSIERQRAELDR